MVTVGGVISIISLIVGTSKLPELSVLNSTPTRLAPSIRASERCCPSPAVGVQVLILDCARQTEIPAGAPYTVIGRTEDLRDDGGGCRQVNHARPSGMVEHLPRSGTGAVAISVWQPSGFGHVFPLARTGGL